MPYGHVSLVMRLFPLWPGYVSTMCADAADAATIAVNMLPSIVRVRVCVFPQSLSKIFP